MGTGRAWVSWSASRPLFPVKSWGAWQPDLPLLAWDPWSTRWACLPGKTRRPHEGQGADFLERLADVAIVAHHLASAWLPLGARGAGRSQQASCSGLPLWPWGPREPWGAGLPSASSNGIARVTFLSLGSWGPRLALHPDHGDPRRSLGAVLARHSWHAPFSLPAMIPLDPWVSLWSRRSRQARRSHEARQPWGS